MKSLKDEFIQRVFLIEIKRKYTPFTTINKALLISSFRKYIWDHFEFPDTVVFPDVQPSLSYGTLSDIVHNEVFRKLVISDLAAPEYKYFMMTLANQYKKGIVEFEEMYSELYEEDIC